MDHDHDHDHRHDAAHDDREAPALALLRERLEDLLEEHDRHDADFGASAVAAIDDLSAALGSDAARTACLSASLRRWAGPHGGVGDVAPWWPTALPDGAPVALLRAALAAVERVGDGLHEQVAAAARGALLLRLGAPAAALVRLNAAAADPACAPETLVDLVVAAARAGDRARAMRALADLRRRAGVARRAASLRWRRCVQAATAALGPVRPWSPRKAASA